MEFLSSSYFWRSSPGTISTKPFRCQIRENMLLGMGFVPEYQSRRRVMFSNSCEVQHIVNSQFIKQKKPEAPLQPYMAWNLEAIQSAVLVQPKSITWLHRDYTWALRSAIQCASSIGWPRVPKTKVTRKRWAWFQVTKPWRDRKIGWPGVGVELCGSTAFSYWTTRPPSPPSIG